MSHETVENVAGAAAGIVAAAFFTLLFIAVSAPVAETVQKLMS